MPERKPEDFIKDGVVMPFVNLNGDKPQSLVDRYSNVIQACRELRGALAETLPHGRNYVFGMEDVAYKLARGQHDRRQQDVDLIKKEMEALREYVALFIK